MNLTVLATIVVMIVTCFSVVGKADSDAAGDETEDGGPTVGQVT